MKHWFVTAMSGTKEDGTTYTMCTQRFYVDDDRTMADLADVFKNAGISTKSIQVRAYIAKNSIVMTGTNGMNLPMADATKVPSIIMGALTAGLGGDVKPTDAMAYGVHFQNVLLKNAVSAYAVERAKCLGEDGGGDGDT